MEPAWRRWRRTDMKKQLGILLGCGVTATALVAVNVLPADEAAATGLVSFGSCSDVLDHLQAEAHERVGPWGLQSGGGASGRLAVEQDGADNATTDLAAPGTQEAPNSHSTTNVQETGVDEPDIVKTDGQMIVTTHGPALRVFDTTGEEPVEVGNLRLSDHSAEADLLLDGDRAMVFVRTYKMLVDSPNAGAPEDTADEPAGDTSMPAPGMHMPSTQVLLVDLSDPRRPTVESSLDVDGDYLDARMVDGTVRLVVSTPPELRFPMGEQGQARDEDELVERNREVIRESTIEDWLPSYRLDADGAESAGELVPCDSLNRPTEFAGFSTMSVLTLDFDALDPDGTVGVLTDGDTVYASTDQLYVATARWAAPAEVTGVDTPRAIAPWPEVESTGIHAFAIGGAGPAEYLASGEVEGEIIGRYAMSEHEGVLRVATTTDARDAENSESHLITLSEQGDELVQAGRVDGLGHGERIYAVRYFDDTGYVVTFRQVDPLYVLDLSDPVAPSVEGELKITGYSSYLHRVGEDRLLGVGQEATEEGRTVGTQVSLFDVSTSTEPRKLDGYVREGAWSGAETDPHAFLYWPETQQIIIPVSGSGPSTRDDEMDGDLPETAGGALVLTVEEDELAERGVITLGSDERRPDYGTAVLRSMVIGDALYTLWRDGLQVNDLDDLGFQSWLPIEPGG